MNARIKSKANRRALALAGAIACVSNSALAAPFVWNGTNNTWISPNWNAGVGGPTGATNVDSATINAGTVTFSGNDHFGNDATAASPVITILNKTGAGAVNGTFSGKPQGSTFTASGSLWSISYTDTRANAALADATTFTGEWSDTLADDWNAAGVSAPVVLTDNGTVQQVKVTLPVGIAGRRFVHLKVSR